MLLGPFGEPLTNPTGLAAEMPFRFSTKYQDAETGLYSYIFRPYDPITGRWLGRDPLEEEGGANLLAFCLNSSINFIDPLGHKADVHMGIAPLGGKYSTVTVFIDANIYWRCSPNDASGKPVLSLEKQRKLTEGVSRRWNITSKRKDVNGARVQYTIEVTVNAKYQMAGDKEDRPYDDNIIIVDKDPGTSLVHTYGKMGKGKTKMTLTKPWDQETFYHEMGHVFGHRDMYWDNGKGGAARRTTPIKNWRGNLMSSGGRGSTVDWRNAEEILGAFEFDVPGIQENIEPPFVITKPPSGIQFPP